MNIFIDWETLDFRKHQGKEKLRCPNCDPIRTDKKDRSLLVDHSEGYGKCFYCEALTFRESQNKEDISYTMPKQDWKNYTQLSDSMVKYIESRKIPQSVAIELGWTQERQYQPQLRKEVDNLVYNFFEGKDLVNKKYRSGNKKFTQSKGGKPILYNINAILGANEIYITEGEMDVAAFCSIGIKNVVSVPNGANDNDEYWKNSLKYIQDCQSFVIAVDNDKKGVELRDRIAQRLGRWRCKYIDFRGKDANDDLMTGNLEDSIKNKKRFPISGTFTIDDVYDEVTNLYENGLPKTIYPRGRQFGDFKKIFSVMKGQLTVVTGIPSHGKSNFLDWYVLNLVKDYNFKCSWFTPEHSPLSLYKTTLIEKVIGRNFWGKSNGVEVQRITKQDLEDYREWARERIYLTESEGGEFPTWDWLFDKFREQMFTYGVDMFVIDAFNKVVLPAGNKLDQISVVLTKLTSFAQSNNVLIFLVAHPTKMKKNDKGVLEVPTLYDVSGSADFRNQTHNGLTVYRNIANESNGTFDSIDVINMKTKFSFQGVIGESVNFQYNPLNGRFYTYDEDNTSILERNGGVETEGKFEVPEPELEDTIPF